MPIEIKELHIRAIVGGRDKPSAGVSLRPEDINKLKKEITREVTEKIKRMLRQKNER